MMEGIRIGVVMRGFVRAGCFPEIRQSSSGRAQIPR